jgi:LPXTG-motif cell wall-anchored protein
MTPARSLAASVIALGFASSLTPPTAAFAAPAPCPSPENYAAQSGAEMLRIDRLAWHANSDLQRPSIKSSESASSSSGSSTSSSSSSSSPRSVVPPSSRRESASVTDTADGLLGAGAGLTDSDTGDSGRGVTGFLSGTGDLLKSITNGRVTGPGGRTDTSTGGQGGGGPVETSSGSPDASIGDVGLGETKSAMISEARTNAVAVGRMVDGDGPLSELLVQTAPPNTDDKSKDTISGTAGPFGFGRGTLGTHAQWQPAMACGNFVGEAAHSSAVLKHFDVLGGGLAHAPNGISSLSSTSFATSAGERQSVATASIDAGRITLADGRVKLQVLQQPKLTVSADSGSGGAVVYQPALVKVTWPGGRSKTLGTAGDSVDVSLDSPTSSGSRGAYDFCGSRGSGSSDSSAQNERPSESTSLSGSPNLDGLLPGAPLPVPSVPGLPSLGVPDAESAPSASNGVSVHISLGEARRATKDHAIAAKATAIKIAISEGCTDDQGTEDRGKDGYGDLTSSLVAQMSVGLLEAAALAPDATLADNTPATATGTSPALPITGPQAGMIAAGGVGLLTIGVLALLASRRRRRTLP